MSNYYTQSAQSNQPSRMTYSSWGQDNGIPAAATETALPEPPVRVNEEDPNATRLSREHFRSARTASDNAIRNSTANAGKPLSPSPSPSVPLPPPGTSDTSTFWTTQNITIVSVSVVCGVVLVGILIYLFVKNRPTADIVPAAAAGGGGGTAAAAAAPTFGSGLHPSAGILNDLEFL